MVRLPLTVEQALLGFLRRQPMHGYEIHQKLSDATGIGRVWRLKQSQLYALLNRLEEEGYIAATQELQENRPPRNVYHLTPDGETTFLDWVTEPVAHGRQFRVEFMVKLYFARLENPEVLQQLLDRQETACREWLTTNEAEAESLQQTAPYDWLVYRFRIGQIQAMLDWLELCRTA